MMMDGSVAGMLGRAKRDYICRSQIRASAVAFVLRLIAIKSQHTNPPKTNNHWQETLAS